MDLKNFLRGMETSVPAAESGVPESASKTSLEGWKPTAWGRVKMGYLSLKNFLRGMETRNTEDIQWNGETSSKTSLEGWKLFLGTVLGTVFPPSKTSLEGWKPEDSHVSPSPWLPQKLP